MNNTVWNLKYKVITQSQPETVKYKPGMFNNSLTKEHSKVERRLFIKILVTIKLEDQNIFYYFIICFNSFRHVRKLG